MRCDDIDGGNPKVSILSRFAHTQTRPNQTSFTTWERCQKQPLHSLAKGPKTMLVQHFPRKLMHVFAGRPGEQNMSERSIECPFEDREIGNVWNNVWIMSDTDFTRVPFT